MDDRDYGDQPGYPAQGGGFSQQQYNHTETSWQPEQPGSGQANTAYPQNEQYYGRQPHQQQRPYGAAYESQTYPQYGGDSYDQPPAQQSYTGYGGQSDYNNQPGETADGERGLMGALAGGAAGAYGGHKLHHGFLGGLAGAYAGHKAEDKLKEHRRKSKEHSRPNSGYNQYTEQPSHASHGSSAGNFAASSQNITLDRDYDLIADCCDVHGRFRLSSISLNTIISNADGRFGWVQGGGNFAASARNVRLVEGGRALEGELCGRDGHWRHDRIWLDEKIENSNGDLRVL